MAIDSMLGKQGMDLVNSFKVGLAISSILYLVAAISVQAFVIVSLGMAIANVAMSITFMIGAVQSENSKAKLVGTVLLVTAVAALLGSIGITCDVYASGNRGSTNFELDFTDFDNPVMSEGGKTTAKTDFYVTQDGTIIPSKSVKTNSNYPVMEIETKSGKAVKTKDVVSEWDNFLGSNQTNIDPFTGQISPDRIWSADGTRSIRFGDHEMNSMGTKNFHYHMEIWHDGYVENILQRIQK